MKKPDEIINDPVKATLFGKFYEEIILKWLEEKEGFTVKEKKPRVYWENIKYVKEDVEGGKKLNSVLKKYKEERKYSIPDGLLEKDGKYYIWEAKNWPLWTEGKKPIDQLRDLLFSMPFILAEEANCANEKYKVDGILFSWWSKPKDVEVLVEEINNLISPRTFKIFYTSDILEECIKNQYDWYKKIIYREKARIDEFWKDLLGESNARVDTSSNCGNNK